MMLPKAHFTSHSRCLALSEWSHHCDYLSHEDPFCIVMVLCILATSSYLCFCLSIVFLSFIESLFAWNVPLVSLVFLKRSLVFPILLFSCIFLHWSLKKAFISFLAILWNSLFRWIYLSFSPSSLASLLSSVIYKITILPFWIAFSWEWSWSLPPVHCHEPPSIIFQSLCLSNLIPWIHLSLLLYNHKGFDLGHAWMSSGFPSLLNISMNIGIRSSWSESQSATHLPFADSIELHHLQLQMI